MVNVRITRRTTTEDYVAVANKDQRYILSPKHILAISSIALLSAILVLPIQIFSFSSDEDSLRDAYLATAEEQQIVEDVNSQENTLLSEITSQENYEDYELPSSLFKDKVHVSPLESEHTFADNTSESKDPNKVTTTATNEALKDNTLEIGANTDNKAKEALIAKAKAPSDRLIKRPTGQWYSQTVRQGDTLSKIFSYLNLPFATLNHVTSVAKESDLALNIGHKIHFLIDSENVVKEVVKPISTTKQVRFTRLKATDNFTVIYEPLNAHVENPDLIARFKSADSMPLAIQAQKEREAKAEAMQLALKKQQEREKSLNKNPLRPRLVIASIERGESFKKAAHRAGLTPTEIITIEKSLPKGLKLTNFKAGDSFRVLFNGIGTEALINAFVIESKSKGNISLYRNSQDGQLYEERGYTPTAGVFRRFPLAGNIKINSHFNPTRRHPVTGRIAPHKGVDFKARVGTPVYAPADGVVTFAGYQRAAGYYMIVRHQGAYSTVYMHLSKLEAKKGNKVVVGQVIAKTGNTGRTTGPHLHYEIRINDRPVDPLKIDLPKSSNPNLANAQKEAFANNVKVYKSDLYRDSLAKEDGTNTLAHNE